MINYSMANKNEQPACDMECDSERTIKEWEWKRLLLRGHFIPTESHLREGLLTPTQNFIVMGSLEKEQRTTKV